MLNVVVNIDNAQWDNFVDNHPYGSILQQSAWGVSKLPNWQPLTLALTNAQNEIVAGGLLLFRHLPFPFAQRSICYVSRGPVVDYHNLDLVKQTLQAIEKFAASQKAIALIFDPSIARAEFAKKLLPYLTKLGYSHQGFDYTMREIQPRCNMILDLQTNQTWTSNVSSTCRSSINKAQRQPFEIVRQKSGDLKDFFALLQETGERDKIGVRNRDYYEHIIHAFRNNDREHFSVIYLKREEALKLWQSDLAKLENEIARNLKRLTKLPAEKQANVQEDIQARQTAITKLQAEINKLQAESRTKIPLACAALLFANNTCHYLYGGSSSSFRNALPVYRLLPELIDLARERGYQQFDFGGVSGITNPQHDRLYGGLYTFKKHWGADMHEYIGEFVRPLSWLYRLFRLAVNLRHKWRHRS